MKKFWVKSFFKIWRHFWVFFGSLKVQWSKKTWAFSHEIFFRFAVNFLMILVDCLSFPLWSGLFFAARLVKEPDCKLNKTCKTSYWLQNEKKKFFRGGSKEKKFTRKCPCFFGPPCRFSSSLKNFKKKLKSSMLHNKCIL